MKVSERNARWPRVGDHFAQRLIDEHMEWLRKRKPADPVNFDGAPLLDYSRKALARRKFKRYCQGRHKGRGQP